MGAPTAILVPSVFIETEYPRRELPLPSMSFPTWVHELAGDEIAVHSVTRPPALVCPAGHSLQLRPVLSR